MVTSVRGGSFEAPCLQIGVLECWNLIQTLLREISFLQLRRKAAHFLVLPSTPIFEHSNTPAATWPEGPGFHDELGSRVSVGSGRMKFVADRMVGKLAVWLRLMGYDTFYRSSITDQELLSMLASSPDRVLISRHSNLVERLEPHRYVFVPMDDPKAQLQYVIRHLGLTPDPSAFFTRCSLCNGLLERVDRSAVAGQVPEYVWTTQEIFSRCRNCGKIYWSGTHVSRFRNKVESLLCTTC